MKEIKAQFETDREMNSTFVPGSRSSAHGAFRLSRASSARRVANALGLALALCLGGCRTTPDATSGTIPNRNTNAGNTSAGGNARFDERGMSNGGMSNSASPGVARSGGPQIEAHFSPRGGCQDALLREINAARRSIWVQAYSFTSAPISDALLKAFKRGVQVRLILDKGQESARYSGATFMTNGGVPVLIDHKHAIAHNKIMIFDGQTLATGSFNFTKSAENSNAENLLIIKNAPSLIQQYQDNFETHAAHSLPYERRADASGDVATGRE